MQGYIAIDIEFTGSGKDDVIFAYGQADSSMSNSKDCFAKSVCLNLFKPHDTTWKDYWIEKNWDPNTFLFWNNFLDVLDFLQDPQKVLFFFQLTLFRFISLTQEKNLFK
jgi:hypothetical protein